MGACLSLSSEFNRYEIERPLVQFSLSKYRAEVTVAQSAAGRERSRAYFRIVIPRDLDIDIVEAEASFKRIFPSRYYSIRYRRPSTSGSGYSTARELRRPASA